MSESSGIHPSAVVVGADIDESAEVGPHAVVLAGARVGPGCRVGSQVTIGKNARLHEGVEVAPGARVLTEATVRANSQIGANATLLPGVTVGPDAHIADGSVVTRDVPAHAIVAGNPAHIRSYTATGGGASQAAPPVSPGGEASGDIRVEGVRFMRAPVFRDLRGSLSAREFGDDSIPFDPKRIFVVFDVPSEEVRGEHAHRECAQLLICVSGAISVMADDGEHRQEWRLDSPAQALYLPPMTWGIQYKYTRDARLLVLASHAYDPDDYVRDYDAFLALKGKPGAGA